MSRHDARFEETQAFGAWVYALLAGAMLLPLLLAATNPAEQLGWVPGLVLVVVFVFTANLLFMRTTVDGAVLTVTFGYLFPLYRRRIPLAEVASAQAVSYSPLGEYGGWGIRGWGDNVALNARGNRGVRLVLRNGKRLLVGSQRPDALAVALGGQRN